MKLHNFHVVARVDGRDNIVSFGPRSKDGGFSLTITMLNRGEIVKAVQIEGKVKDNGAALLLIVDGSDGYSYVRDHSKGEFTIVTER